MNTDDVLRTLLEMLTYGNRRFATRYAEELLERLEGDGPMPDPEIIMDFACGQLTRTC